MRSNGNFTYFGKSYHHFFPRNADHIDVSNPTGKWLERMKDSAVLDHL